MVCTAIITAPERLSQGHLCKFEVGLGYEILSPKNKTKKKTTGGFRRHSRKRMRMYGFGWSFLCGLTLWHLFLEFTSLLCLAGKHILTLRSFIALFLKLPEQRVPVASTCLNSGECLCWLCFGTPIREGYPHWDSLWSWQCFVSALSDMAVTRHMWLLNTWNVACMSEETDLWFDAFK